METVPGAGETVSAPAGDDRAMAWPSPASPARALDPTGTYDVAVVGGGLQGLATAHSLARDFGPLRIVLLEADRIGDGAPAWDDTVFLGALTPRAAAAPLYDRALTLWSGLSRRLRTSVPVYPRIAISPAHDRATLYDLQQRVVALRKRGLSVAWQDRDADLDRCAWLDSDPASGLPILGAAVASRAGVASRRALAAAYRRALERLGVTLVDRCPVVAIATEGGRAVGVETPYGSVRADKVALAVGTATRPLAESAGLRLPLSIRTVPILQSDPVAPTLDALVASDAIGGVIGQAESGTVTVRGTVGPMATDRLVGSGTDDFASRMAALVALMPRLSRLPVRYRRDRRVALFPDGNPAIGATPVAGLLLSAGWGTDAAAVAPAAGECLARLIATGTPPEDAAPFALDRFATATVPPVGGTEGAE